MPTLREQLQETALVMKKSAESSSKIIHILINLKRMIGEIEDGNQRLRLLQHFGLLNTEINTSSEHTETALEMYNGIIDKMAAELHKMQEGKDVDRK